MCRQMAYNQSSPTQMCGSDEVCGSIDFCAVRPHGGAPEQGQADGLNMRSSWRGISCDEGPREILSPVSSEPFSLQHGFPVSGLAMPGTVPLAKISCKDSDSGKSFRSVASRAAELSVAPASCCLSLVHFNEVGAFAPLAGARLMLSCRAGFPVFLRFA